MWLFSQNRQTLLCKKLDLRQLLSFRIPDFTLKFYVILKTDLTYLMRKFKSRVPHDKLYAAVSMARSHSSSASPNAKSWREDKEKLTPQQFTRYLTTLYRKRALPKLTEPLAEEVWNISSPECQIVATYFKRNKKLSPLSQGISSFFFRSSLCYREPTLLIR